MTVALTGGTGLFDQLGALAAGLNEHNNYRGTTTLGPRVTTVRGTYPTAEANALDQLYTQRDSGRSAMATWLSYLQSLAGATFQVAVQNDLSLTAQKSVLASIDVVIAQMKNAAASIQRPTLGSSVSYTPPSGVANHGAGVFVASTTDPADGLPLDMMFQESIEGYCSADSFAGGGGASAGSEPFAVTTPAAAPSTLDWQWPGGSGVSRTLSCCAGNSTSTPVADGSFQTWNGGTPQLSNWQKNVGTWGTDLKQNNAPYRSSLAYNLEFVGDGATLSEVYQSVSLQPNTVYAVGCLAKQTGGGAGVFKIRLTDNTFTAISDANSVANSISTTVSTLSGSYGFITGFFRTPAVLPSTVYLSLQASTAIAAATKLEVGYVQIVPVTALYNGGPYIQGFQGTTDWARGDYFKVAATNNKGVTSFCRILDRLFNLRDNARKFPSASSPTVSDSLVA